MSFDLIIMWLFNYIFGKIFEILFYPFQHLSSWVGMIVISFLTGLFMLFVFGKTSNQRGIKRIKNKIKAHLLELRLYKDSLNQSLKAQGQLFRCNLKYISYSVKPMLVMIIPLILIIIQLNLWFAHRPFSPGEKTLLKVKLEKNYNPLQVNLTVKPSSGVIIDSPPVRIKEESEIDWRVLIQEKGVHELFININGKQITKKVVASSKSLNKISPLKVEGNFFNLLLHPGEPPLPKQIPLQSVEINYPPQGMNLWGWRIHWIIPYFVLSVLFGFIFKGVFKVEI